MVCKAFAFHQLTHMWLIRKRWPSLVASLLLLPVPFVKWTFTVLQRPKFLMSSEYIFYALVKLTPHFYRYIYWMLNISRTKITKDHISTMIKAYVPQSLVEGFYRGEGRFNNLKIKSKGYFNVTASKFWE